MAVFLWIWQFIGPIAIILGGLYFLEEPGRLPLVLGIIAAVFGLIIGIVGWADTVPPRWFWIKSTSELAEIKQVDMQVSQAAKVLALDEMTLSKLPEIPKKADMDALKAKYAK